MSRVIATALGVQSVQDLIISKLRPSGPQKQTVVVFDNFESAWDIGKRKNEVEHVLAAITRVRNVNVVVTMRGCVSPAETEWIPTTFAELPSLSLHHARAVFTKLSQRATLDPATDQLLVDLDCMPLAVTLMAQLAKLDIPLTDLLKLWDKQKSLMLARDGNDRTSNLDISIGLSLNSPQMKNTPKALEILSVLSLLPDGLPDGHFRALFSDIDNIILIDAQHTLLRLSLVRREQEYLRVLAPIRAYMTVHHYPSDNLLHLGIFYLDLVEMHHYGRLAVDAGAMIPAFGNIITVLSELIDRKVSASRALRTFHEMYAFMTNSRKLSIATAEKCLFYAQQERKRKRKARQMWMRSILRLAHLMPYINCQSDYPNRLEKEKDWEVLLSFDLAGLHYHSNLVGIGDGVQTMTLFKEALKLARKRHDSLTIIMCLRGMAELYRLDRDYPQVFTILSEAIELSKRRQATVDHIGSLCCVADAHRDLGHISDAISTLKEALQLCPNAELNPDPAMQRAVALCFSELGDAYRIASANGKALECYKDAVRIFKLLGVIYSTDICLWRMGEVYRCQRDYVQAYNALDESMNLADMNNFVEVKRDCLVTMARIGLEQSHYDKALNDLQHAWDITLGHEIMYDRGICLWWIARCEEWFKRPDKALEKLQEAKRWHEKDGYSEAAGQCDEEIRRLRQAEVTGASIMG